MDVKTRTEKLRGYQLVKVAIDHIIAHPETWDQTIIWHSSDGKRHCLFGLCQILAGFEANNDDCFEEVRELLGLRTPDAAWLCAPNRTLEQIRWFADEMVKGLYPREACNAQTRRELLTQAGGSGTSAQD